jgi:mono/diheme cytochrome c family protein
MPRPLPYDPARMNRPIRVLSISIAAAAIAASATACGTQKISVPQSDPTHRGAVLFSQRCSGCHTLSYAATNGSATNVRTAFQTNGPNFNIRCERPVTRVLYAIENGGFSGAVMPQNIVVGHDAAEVAQFVAKFAGRQAPKITGLTPCTSQPVGTLPAPGQTATTAASTAPPAAAATGLASTSAAVKAKVKSKSKPKASATGNARGRGKTKRKTARR